MMRLNIPYLDDKELTEISKVLETGFLTQGPKTAQFEQIVADYIGCKYAFAMSSCTTALHLALVVLGVQSGDEVLVADFTFPATANVVVQLGAVPVLVDINLKTFTMDPVDLERKITDRTRVIIPVDAFGCAADYDSINKIAAANNLPVVEDAATAIGTKYYDRFCGNLTTLGCFSFHPRKVITTGEGGMITTNDDHLAERVKLLRSHGGVRTGSWYQYEEAGFNYRLSDVLSAIGVVQMGKLPYIVGRKREMARMLSDKLAGLDGVRVPVNPEWDGHIFQSYVILLDQKYNRDMVVAEMRELGIETTLGTYALHDQPFYQRHYEYKSGQLPKSHQAFSQTVTLPMYPQMTDDDLDQIADTLQRVLSLPDILNG
ncbi:MAG: DegT/DnrJ/EryC1/StrS family aminotransferase [Anaerolineales bacterium]|nr:DegT/DnrJ/EryC1/StrS family aminotransferase [Anaerolineales bacterium]